MTDYERYRGKCKEESEKLAALAKILNEESSALNEIVSKFRL